MRIPLGSQIFPCRSSRRELGTGRRTTIEVDFESDEIVARFSALDPATGAGVEFVCLPLDENPAGYDCYAVAIDSIEGWSREAVFETERLVFRRFDAEDADGMYRLNADPEVIRFTGNDPFASPQEARALIDEYEEYAKHGMGRWSVFRKPHGEYVGWCGLKFTPGLDEVDIGFRFFRSVWNQGIATEAAGATLRYGFEELGLTIIVGRAMEENKASHRVLEKLGMGYMSNFESDGHSWRRYEIDVNRWRSG